VAPGGDLFSRARAWAQADPDPATRAELEGLIEAGDTEAIEERFSEPLVFGTAGLRGALGAGPARMNRLVVRQTAAGVAGWVRERGLEARRAGVVVGRDARHGSEAFANDTADVVASAGVRVRRFVRHLPTPITAFAVRHLQAAAGVMVTASHNPPQDNGYKVYASDGAQIIPPDDARIAELSARHGAPPVEPLSAETLARIETLDEPALLDAYAKVALALLEPTPERELSCVYTPMHGVGGAIVPDLFVAAGFAPPVRVPAQFAPDPDFPTVAFPNPEEPGALDLALAEASRHDVDLVIANDPDADRLAIAVREAPAKYRILSGNELGSILGDHLIASSSGTDRLVATTIVSSRMLSAIADAAGVAFAETLTGFKWIARAQQQDPGHRLLFGYEEALGYAVSDAVADKDGMTAALVVAGLAAREKARGRTLLDRLADLERRFGVHATDQVSLRRSRPEGIDEIEQLMVELRKSPPTEIANRKVTEVVDYLPGRPDLPKSNVLAFFTDDNARVVVRPSGTEPKLKAYLEVKSAPVGSGELASARRRADTELAELRNAVETLLTRCSSAGHADPSRLANGR
jgi:phosphomannomutase